jgi:hypothetical protein
MSRRAVNQWLTDNPLSLAYPDGGAAPGARRRHHWKLATHTSAHQYSNPRCSTCSRGRVNCEGRTYRGRSMRMGPVHGVGWTRGLVEVQRRILGRPRPCLISGDHAHERRSRVNTPPTCLRWDTGERAIPTTTDPKLLSLFSCARRWCPSRLSTIWLVERRLREVCVALYGAKVSPRRGEKFVAAAGSTGR